VADGWVAAVYVFVWQIALFVSLGQSLLAYGGALAFAALVGAIGALTLGRHIDAGHGKQAVWYAFGMFARIVVLRKLRRAMPRSPSWQILSGRWPRAFTYRR
jgi:MFS transporter, DHA1 family, inner membrane transport protein